MLPEALLCQQSLTFKLASGTRPLKTGTGCCLLSTAKAVPAALTVQDAGDICASATSGELRHYAAFKATTGK